MLELGSEKNQQCQSLEVEDTKDKDLGKEALNKMEDTGVTLMSAGGLRRSRRVRKLPPLPAPPQSEGGGSSAAGERKRKRGGGEEAEEGEEVSHDDGVEVKVTRSVKVSSPAKVSLIGGAGVEGREEEAAGSRSPRPLQLLRGEKGRAHQSKKVGGAVVKLDGASSSVVMNSAAGRSENGSLKQSAGEEEAHPCLLNEDVLDVIFKHVMNRPGTNFDRSRVRAISNDIKSARLVCKAWMDSATRAYRRFPPTPTKFLEHYQLNKFMKVMKSSDMIPVQKFDFYGHIFRQKNLKMFRDFLLICGPEVVYLGMSMQPSDSERIMSNLKNLPELNMLKLRDLRIGTSETDHEFANLVKLFLTAAKNLKNLVLTYSPAPPYSAYTGGQVAIMQQLGPIIASGVPKTVKRLHLNMEVDESTLNKLAHVGLELEYFDFGVPFKLEQRTLYAFFQSQAATLKDFRLSKILESQFQPQGICLEFPRLDELDVLHLSKAVANIVKNSDFAKTFPKLRVLEFVGFGDTGDALRAVLSKRKTPTPSLKVLSLPSLRNASLAPFIKDVAWAFPCIENLTLGLHHNTKETLLEVFKYFPNLESLDISFCEQGQLARTIESKHRADSLFSGISEVVCSRISRLQEFADVNLNDFHRQPSILNLTKLKYLTVANMGPCIGFTDFTAHFVFSEMESLREICFSIGHDDINPQFSPKYVDRLRERLIARGGSGNFKNWL